MAININKKILIIPVLILISISVLYFYYIQNNLDDLKIKQQEFKEGDKIISGVPTTYKNYTKVSNVKITFKEMDTGLSITNSSTEKGYAVIPITIGKTYLVTATYNNSTKSETITIKPNYFIGVTIADNNTIDSIFLYKVQTP